MAKVSITKQETDVYVTREVKSTFDEKEANELLKSGWRLLHGGLAHRGVDGFHAKPCYVLAR